MENSEYENFESICAVNDDAVSSNKLSFELKKSKSNSSHENDCSFLISEEYKDIVAETQNKLLSLDLDFRFTSLHRKHETNFASTPKAFTSCSRPLENPNSSKTNDDKETPSNYRTFYSTLISDCRHSRASNGFTSLNQSSPQFYSCLSQSNRFYQWVSKPTFSPEINNLLEKNSLDETFPEVNVVPKSSSSDSGRSQNSNTANSLNRKSRSKEKLTLDFDELILLKKLKQALEYLGITPESQWESICEMLKAKDDDMVRFGDFVEIAKKVFFKEMDTNQITCGSLFFTAVDGSVPNGYLEKENPENSKEKTTKYDDMQSEILKLKNDLKETENKCCLAENELLFVRKKLQESIQNNRDISNKLHLSKIIPQSSKGVQTDKDYEKYLHHLHRSLYNNRWLYEIATNKLLQFTQMVHDILIAHNQEKASGNKRSHRSPQAAKKPVRATTVKIASNDVSNYFVHKYGGGGRICRAASVCTVGCSGKATQKNTTDGNQLQQLAEKAQELVQAITSILEEERKSLVSTSSYGRRLKYKSDSRCRKETFKQQPVERCKSTGFIKPKKDIVAWV